MSDSEYGEDSFCEAEICSAAAELCDCASQTSPHCITAIDHAATAGALSSTAIELVQAVLTHCVAAIAQSQLDNTACKGQPCTGLPLCIEDNIQNGSAICAMSESDSAQAADSGGKLTLQCDLLQTHDVLGKLDRDRSSSSSSSSDTATGTLSDRSIASSTNKIVNISDSCAGNTITACSSKQLGSSTTTAVIRSAQPSWTPCYRPASAVPVHGITVKLTQCSAVKRKLASAERQRQQHTAHCTEQKITSTSQQSVVNPYVRTRPHWSNMKMSYDEAAWVARRKAALLPQSSERVNSSSSSTSFDSSRQHAKRRPATARPTARYTLQPLQMKLEPRAKSRMHVAIAAGCLRTHCCNGAPP
eukprot:783-Heterococcus_DN1.PRE.1